MSRCIETLVVFIALVGGTADAAGIQWHASLDAAFADAKARNAPVFFAVNMDGERANDELVSDHYRDPRIVELAAKCASVFVSVDDHSGDSACKRCGGPVTCVQHQAIEKAARDKFVKSSAKGGFVAPQHVLAGPDGVILLSVAYRISVAELEWCLVAAIRTLDPKFEWKLADKAKPPHRLVRGALADAGAEASQRAPTKKEVDEILSELAKSKKIFEKVDLLLRLLRSSDKRAIDYFDKLMATGMPNREDALLELLRAIGRTSPPEYAPLVQPFLADERPAVRTNAIVALELLANPKSLAPLTKAFKKKDCEPRFQKDLVRAIAACGAADAATAKLVLSTIDSAADPIVRANAMLGAEHLEKRADVLTACDAALAQQEVAELRFAAGWVIAALHDEARKAALEAAAAKESDSRAKSALAMCVQVLATAQPLSALDPFLRDLCQSDVPRDRL
jgi:HEAT repeats